MMMKTTKIGVIPKTTSTRDGRLVLAWDVLRCQLLLYSAYSVLFCLVTSKRVFNM